MPPEAQRILYVENGIGYGGAVICLRHLVRNLDRQRFKPMVVTGRTGAQYREIATEAEWQHIPDRRIDIVGMRRALDRSAWAGHVPALRWLIYKLLARLDDVGNFLPFFLQLFALAVRSRPALIHVNNEPLCNRAAVLAGRLLGVPVICHVRGTPNASRLTRWLYRLPHHFIPVSHWISNGLSKLDIPKTMRTVVYDGIELGDLAIDTDGTPFRARFGISHDAYVVGLIGLLIPWKGQHLFLDTARTLSKEIPNLKMLIIGGTPEECVHYEKELRARVQAEHLDATVIFTGHVDHMPEVYNALDVVVSASTSPEPLGTMVIECMAMARPLVAPDHGGGAEMNEHERTALLFEPGNADELAATILRLYRDPAFARRLGALARIKALETFAVERHVQEIESVYDQVLASGRHIQSSAS